MKRLCRQQQGFSLIEMAVIIIVVGILTAVAMRSATNVIDDTRRTRTEREMQMLADAIVGNPDITSSGIRSDFGYVGDVGAFPPNLDALTSNPGGYATWQGPYTSVRFTQDSSDLKLDAWGSAYSYSGGITITSSGSGTTLVQKIADAPSDYLLNQLTGRVTDVNATVPGALFDDSVDVVITVPNGAGSIINKTYQPDSTGFFALDSLPVGTHALRVIYTPEVDTIFRYVTILPRHRNASPPVYKFASAYFAGGVLETLRPDGAGTLTELASTGCVDNFACVSEVVADDDASYVYTSANSQWRDDTYSIEDHSVGSGTVLSVTVYMRARRTGGSSNRFGKALILSGGNRYEGAQQSLTQTWTEYSEVWTTNPATGLAWTWTDIDNLEAGVSLYRQGGGGQHATCTQVWVEVEYLP